MAFGLNKAKIKCGSYLEDYIKLGFVQSLSNTQLLK